MPFPFADRKTWENTRPSDIKDTGLGAACDAWKKSCKPYKEIADDKAKTSAALVAIDKMLGALKDAGGKASKVKDPKKKKAVEDLLKEWKKETEDYQKGLNAAVFKSVEGELGEKIEKAKKEYLVVFSETERQLKEVIPGILDKAEDCLKKKDTRGAETQLQNAKGKIKYAVLAVNKPQEAIGVQEKNAGLTPGKILPKEFASHLNPAKTLIKDLYARVEKLEAEFDEADVLTDPSTSKGDEAYKKKYEAILKAYKDTLSKLQGLPAKMNELFKKAQQVNGNPLLEKNPEGMVKVIEKLIADTEAIEKESAETLFDIREDGGKTVQLRKAAKLEEEDTKSFGPFMTRGMTMNGRVLSAKIKLEDELREALETIIGGGKTEAVGPAKALLAKL
jgi:hypothetical protein